MSDTPSLNAAKIMLREKRLNDAIAMFERVKGDASKDSAEAAYCLGIIYHSGSGVPKNVNEAKNYYLFAEEAGYAMATYRLGGIYYQSGDLQKAYDSYRVIAQDNPSAAYRAYELLTRSAQLDRNPGEAENYLQSAAMQGHVLAQRIIAMRYISGRHGLRKIPYGMKLFFERGRNAIRAVNKNEKLKYN